MVGGWGLDEEKKEEEEEEEVNRGIGFLSEKELRCKAKGRRP